MNRPSRPTRHHRTRGIGRRSTRGAVWVMVLVFASACGDGLGPDLSVPRLEYVHVDADAGAMGVTTVVWSHREGAAALDPGSASVIFMGRHPDGSSDARSPEPVSRTERADGTVELVYHDGRNVPTVRVAHADTRGRWLTADCIRPTWRCETVKVLSYPTIPLP